MVTRQGYDAGVLKPSDGCVPGKYRRLYLYTPAYRPEPSPPRGVLEKRASILAKSPIRNAQDLATLTYKLLGAEITKREHVLFVLVDMHGKVRLLGAFSSKHASLCAFHFRDMVPDLEFALVDTAKPGGLFMIHNHPSGHAAFSEDDLIVTRHVSRLHNDLPFGLVDSVVVTKGGAFVSLRQEQERTLYDTRYQIALRDLRFRDFQG